MGNTEEWERSFPEEWHLENGNYQNRCSKCGHLFFGHKRRTDCKRCVSSKANAEEGREQPIKETPEQVLSRVKDEVARKNNCKSFSEHLYGGNCQLIDVELIAIRFNEEMEKQKAKPEEVKSLPSMEEYYNKLFPLSRFSSKDYYKENIGIAMESYKALCVEQERNRIEEDVMITIAECLPEGHVHEEDYQRLKTHLLAIFKPLNNGN